MIRYYVDDSLVAPEAVECEKKGYPHRDVLGRIQYENSHYDDEARAWEHLFRSERAGISLSAREIEDAERRLNEARVRAAEDVKRSAAVRRNFEAWERAREDAAAAVGTDDAQGTGAAGTPLEGAAQPGVDGKGGV